MIVAAWITSWRLLRAQPALWLLHGVTLFVVLPVFAAFVAPLIAQVMAGLLGRPFVAPYGPVALWIAWNCGLLAVQYGCAAAMVWGQRRGALSLELGLLRRMLVDASLYGALLLLAGTLVAAAVLAGPAQARQQPTDLQGAVGALAGLVLIAVLTGLVVWSGLGVVLAPIVSADRRCGLRQATTESWQLAAGRRRQLLGLLASMVVLNALGLAALFVAVFVTNALASGALVAFYDARRGELGLPPGLVPTDAPPAPTPTPPRFHDWRRLSGRRRPRRRA